LQLGAWIAEPVGQIGLLGQRGERSAWLEK
jgi:hypothetical protein